MLISEVIQNKSFHEYAAKGPTKDNTNTSVGETGSVKDADCAGGEISLVDA